MYTQYSCVHVAELGHGAQSHIRYHLSLVLLLDKRWHCQSGKNEAVSIKSLSFLLNSCISSFQMLFFIFVHFKYNLLPCQTMKRKSNTSTCDIYSVWVTAVDKSHVVDTASTIFLVYKALFWLIKQVILCGAQIHFTALSEIS